jgi:hypothetical protein
LLQPPEFFIAGRIGDPAGLDKREVGLGDGGASRQLIEGEAEAAALAAKFGS